MVIELMLICILAIIFGFIASYLIFNKTRWGKKFNPDNKLLKDFIKNPELLVQELNKNGEMIDDGEKIEYKVVKGKIQEIKHNTNQNNSKKYKKTK